MLSDDTYNNLVTIQNNFLDKFRVRRALYDSSLDDCFYKLNNIQSQLIETQKTLKSNKLNIFNNMKRINLQVKYSDSLNEFINLKDKEQSLLQSESALLYRIMHDELQFKKLDERFKFFSSLNNVIKTIINIDKIEFSLYYDHNRELKKYVTIDIDVYNILIKLCSNNKIKSHDEVIYKLIRTYETIR